jgi:hypothetical protein
MHARITKAINEPGASFASRCALSSRLPRTPTLYQYFNPSTSDACSSSLGLVGMRMTRSSNTGPGSETGEGAGYSKDLEHETSSRGARYACPFPMPRSMPAQRTRASGYACVPWIGSSLTLSRVDGCVSISMRLKPGLARRGVLDGGVAVAGMARQIRRQISFGSMFGLGQVGSEAFVKAPDIWNDVDGKERGSIMRTSAILEISTARQARQARPWMGVGRVGRETGSFSGC